MRQRITIAKIGGVAADLVVHRLREWAEARRTSDPTEWSKEQWPPEVRRRADAFADRLRGAALVPPVIHFVEWVDLWSMGDMFHRWLTPPVGRRSILIHGDRFQVYGYSLPDEGRLERHLATAGRQQYPESDLFVGRLLEAVEAWKARADQAVLIVLREVLGGLVTDEELVDSLSTVPDWLVEA